MIDYEDSSFMPCNHGFLVWNPLHISELPIADMVLVAFAMEGEGDDDECHVIVTTAFTTGRGTIDYSMLDFEEEEVSPLAWMPMPEPFAASYQNHITPSRN